MLLINLFITVIIFIATATSQYLQVGKTQSIVLTTQDPTQMTNALQCLGSYNKHISRGAPDPELCYLAGSGSMPDPDMSDPDPNRILITWIRPDPAGSGSKSDHNWKRLE